MDYRTESFKQRFTSAIPHLNAQNIREIVSFKSRDTVASYSEYAHFVDDYLKSELRFDVKQIPGEFGGRAWLIKDKSQNSAILVEHETGLEVLGIVGSIASLISLIPLIVSGWTRLRHRFSHHRPDDPGSGIEIRNFNQRNILVEKHSVNVEIYIIQNTLQESLSLKQKVQDLEREVGELKKAQVPKKKRENKKTVLKGGKKRHR